MVPTARPVVEGERLGERRSRRWRWGPWKEVSVAVDGHHACEELEVREGRGMPQDERHGADGRLEDEFTHGERTEVREMQRGER